MYGRPGEMPQYCSAHKAEDMVDVKKRRRCNADNCERRASYALDGEKAAFCSAHKQAGHVNVNNRRCVWCACLARPCIGRPLSARADSNRPTNEQACVRPAIAFARGDAEIIW